MASLKSIIPSAPSYPRDIGHARRRTNAEKRNHVIMALRCYPERSDRTLAGKCGVSESMVRAYRRRLMDEVGQIAPCTLTVEMTIAGFAAAIYACFPREDWEAIMAEVSGRDRTQREARRMEAWDASVEALTLVDAF